MSLKLYTVNNDYFVAENGKAAEVMFENKYPHFSDTLVINEIDYVGGYRIVPMGSDISRTLEQITKDYLEFEKQSEK